jgi:hypothetical protein
MVRLPYESEHDVGHDGGCGHDGGFEHDGGHDGRVQMASQRKRLTTLVVGMRAAVMKRTWTLVKWTWTFIKKRTRTLVK